MEPILPPVQPPDGNATSQPGVDRYQVNRSLPDLMYAPVAASNAAVPIMPERPKKSLWKRALLTFWICLSLVLLTSAGWVGWKLIQNGGKLFGIGNLFSLFSNSRLKGEDRGRVNILLAGNSADDPGHAGAQLTDSIMLVSLDTKNHTAFMLSIPRDLYVDIPGFGYSKINATYQDGNSSHFHEDGYADNGMGLLEKVVSTDFNVPIDYYALINYSTFREAVDAVGGITVTINSPDRRGLYDPYAQLKLPNGPIELNGQTALNLARSRGDGPGSYGFVRADFDRTAHQRQMLVALKDKATSANVLANPVKLGQLSDAIGNNVQTDLKIENVRRLYSLSKSVDSSQIKSLSLDNANGKDLLKSYRTKRGESALIPSEGLDDYSAIQAFVAQITGSGS